MTKKSDVTEEKKKIVPGETRFTREQALTSARYKSRKDLVAALLNDGRTYTIAEVDQMISRFMKGQVK